MKKSSILTAVSIVALLALTAFLWGRFHHEIEPPQTVRIGALLPLNNDLMAVATRMKSGMELARSDLLKKYGERVAISIDYQNGCYEREAAAAVQKFVHDGVSIIGGSFCLFGHIPILPLIEAHRIITFNTATNPDVVLNKRYAFSTNVEVKDQAEAMADFAFHALRGRRAVTMHLDTPFGHDYNKYFKRRFEALGGEVLFNIPDAPDGKNFRVVVPRIKDERPDVIVTAHFGVPLGLFFKAVRDAGIQASILGNYETEDSDVLFAAGDAAEGVYIATSAAKARTNAMGRFESSYIRKYGLAPDAIVTNSYDAVVLGVESAISCKGDRECMREEMRKVENYQGASGVITIKASGATDKPTAFKVIRSRTFIRFDDEVAH